MSSDLTVKIWRRGRGVIDWKFEYVTSDDFWYYGHGDWFTTPGWYHFARDYVYRLTIDHDYPSKPLWLGRRENGEWVSMEGLYEPLAAIHRDYIFASSRIQRPGRSGLRVKRSERLIKRTVESVLGGV